MYSLLNWVHHSESTSPKHPQTCRDHPISPRAELPYAPESTRFGSPENWKNGYQFVTLDEKGWTWNLYQHVLQHTEKSYTYNSDSSSALTSWQIGGNNNSAHFSSKEIILQSWYIARCIGRGWVNITSHGWDVHGTLRIQWDGSIFPSHTHLTSPNHPPETPPWVYRHRILGPTNHRTSSPEQNVIVGSWSLELLEDENKILHGIHSVLYCIHTMIPCLLFCDVIEVIFLKWHQHKSWFTKHKSHWIPAYNLREAGWREKKKSIIYRGNPTTDHYLQWTGARLL